MLHWNDADGSGSLNLKVGWVLPLGLLGTSPPSPGSEAGRRRALTGGDAEAEVLVQAGLEAVVVIQRVVGRARRDAGADEQRGDALALVKPALVEGDQHGHVRLATAAERRAPASCRPC